MSLDYLRTTRYQHHRYWEVKVASWVVELEVQSVRFSSSLAHHRLRLERMVVADKRKDSCNWQRHQDDNSSFCSPRLVHAAIGTLWAMILPIKNMSGGLSIWLYRKGFIVSFPIFHVGYGLACFQDNHLLSFFEFCSPNCLLHLGLFFQRLFVVKSARVFGTR